MRIERENLTSTRARNLKMRLSVIAILTMLSFARSFVRAHLSTGKCKRFDVEWELVKHIFDLLKPLYRATRNLSKSKCPSLSTTLPVYMTMIKVNKNVKER